MHSYFSRNVQKQLKIKKNCFNKSYRKLQSSHCLKFLGLLLKQFEDFGSTWIMKFPKKNLCFGTAQFGAARAAKQMYFIKIKIVEIDFGKFVAGFWFWDFCILVRTILHFRALVCPFCDGRRPRTLIFNC